jgi:hypothetical protein
MVTVLAVIRSFVNKKKPKEFSKNKKSFDSVLSYLRSLSGLGTISAVNLESAGGRGTPNLAKPLPIDFKVDCYKVFKKIVPSRNMAKFLRVYTVEECRSELIQEMIADKVLGPSRHSYEQRCGAEFIKRHIYPVQGRGGYFTTIKVKGNK